MALENGIIIRRAVLEDAACIHRMVGELASALEFSDLAKGSVEDISKYGFGEDAFFHSLIAERNGKAIGLCTYFPVFSSWKGCPGVFVLDLFIAKSERRSGLGEKLLANVASISREFGAAFMRLSVDNHNVKAQAFYRRIGFGPVDDETTYQINTEEFDTLTALAGSD